jgi:hypothetical protein
MRTEYIGMNLIALSYSSTAYGHRVDDAFRTAGEWLLVVAASRVQPGIT